MKILSFTPEFTFDDILLLPNKSDFSIEDENTKINLKTKVSRNIQLDAPILSAPMPSVTESKMAIAVGEMGGMGFIHHFQSHEKQLDQIAEVKNHGLKVAASIAEFNDDGIHQIKRLLNMKTDLISLESANAHNIQTIKFLKLIKKKFKGIEVSVAVMVTEDAVKDLIQAGADSIRIGIGGGSHCTTRLVTGVGRAQLSAIKSCHSVTKKYNVPLISDTGIKYAGDIAKALVFGADSVMIGGLFTGTDECPGKIMVRKGKKYKISWGMCTKEAYSFNKSGKTGFVGTLKNIFKRSMGSDAIFEEGIKGTIPYKGSVGPIFNNLLMGLRRSMWYQGSKNLKELRQKARVTFITDNTRLENLPRI